MKRTLLIFLTILFPLGRGCALGASAPVYLQNNLIASAPASTIPTAPSPVQPQLVDFTSCSKFFPTDSQKLFYLTLASANANRFSMDEIQSKSGYIVFSVGSRQFLASVISVDSKNSMLKITPCNNNYYFPIGIVQNFFKYIDLNIKVPIEKLINT